MDSGRYDGNSSFEAIELAQATPGTGGSGGLVSPAVGRVDTVIGRVTITRADGTQLTAESGQSIFQGDQVTTAVDGKLGIVFADNSSFSIGERGNMTIDEMVYDPGTQTGKSVVNITTGVFSFVSGQLAKSGPESMVLHTPVAVIGIRGTTGAGKAAPAGQPNTFALLPDASGGTGEISITTQTGTTTMNLPFQALQVVNPFLPPPAAVVVPAAVMAKAFGGVTAALPQQSQPPMSGPTGPGAGPAAGPTGPGAGPGAGPAGGPQAGPGGPAGPGAPGGPGIPGGPIGPGGPTAQQQQAIQQQVEAAVNRAFDQAAAGGAGNIDGAMAAAVQVSAVAATMMASMFAGGPGGPGGFGGPGGPGGPGGAPAFANIAAALNAVVSNAVTAGMAFAGQGPGIGGPQGGPVGLPGGLPAGLAGFFGPGPGPNGPGGPGSFGPAGPGQFGPAGPGQFGPGGPGQFGPGGPGQFGPGQFGPGQFGPGDFGGPGQFGPISGIFGPGPGDFGGPIGVFGDGFGLFAAEGVFYAGIGDYGILQVQDVTVFETPESTYIGFEQPPTTNFDETLIGSSGNDVLTGTSLNTNFYMGNGLLGGLDAVNGGGGTNQLTFDDLTDLRFTLTADGSTANKGTISITTIDGTNYNPASTTLTPYSTSTIEFTGIQQFLFADGVKHFSSGYQTGNTSLNTSAAPTSDADVIVFPSLGPGEKGTVWAGTSGADTITVTSALAPDGALVFGKGGGDTIDIQAMNMGFYIGGATATDNVANANGIASQYVNAFTYASLNPVTLASATGLSIWLVAADAYNGTAGYGGDGLAKDYKTNTPGWNSTLLQNLWDVGALTGSLGADQIIVSGGGTAGGFAFIAGGAGDDTIQLISGTTSLKVGYVDGGAGNDSYSLGSGLAFSSTFNVIDEGGSGADPGSTGDSAIFYLANGASIAPTVSGVEAITFDLSAAGATATFSGANVTGATSYGANNAIGSGSTLTLTNIGATSFTASGAAGNVNITFSSSVTGPSVIGGDGNDSVTLSAALSSATINLGAGTDSVTLASGTNSSVSLTSVENVYGTTGNESLSLGANVSGVTFDFGAGTADRVTAPAGGNSFTTLNVEFVYGGSSADSITVGQSTDAVTLYGGQGADALTLNSSSTVIASYTDTNEFGDTINAFTSGVDKIGFRGTLFTAIDDSAGGVPSVGLSGVDIDFTAAEVFVSTVNTGTDANVVDSTWVLANVVGTTPARSAGDDAIIVVSAGASSPTKSAVWYWSDADGTETTADLTLVATVDSTTFATGDIQPMAVTA